MLSISSILYGQEICNDCIDNDGDGLADCYDADCRNALGCKEFFIARSSLDTPVPCTLEWEMNLAWSDPSINASTLTILAADMDNDGITEVYVDNSYYNGNNGNMISTLPGSALAYSSIADVDNDGLGDNFINNSSAGGLSRMEYGNPTPIWSKSGITATASSIADFNGDGLPELYFDGMILNAINGDVLLDASSIIVKGLTSNDQNATIAVDILPSNFCPQCEGLELVNSNQIISVDITTGNFAIEVNGPIEYPKGTFAVADMNLDDQLDVIVNAEDVLYVYDGVSGSEIGHLDYTSSPIGRVDWPLVGNFDLDPFPEVFIRNDTFSAFVVDHTFKKSWDKKDLGDLTFSLGMGASAFDFNCDGIDEIVTYNNSATSNGSAINIVKGLTGEIVSSFSCATPTGRETPIIADVNGDNHADIICGCFDGLKVLTNDSWAPARNIWNQFAYHTVNINDDLTVPCEMPNHANNQLPDEFNAFFRQSAIYDSSGQACKRNSASPTIIDASITIDTFAYDNQCDSAAILFTVCNEGIIPIQAGLPYTIYALSNDTLLTLEQGQLPQTLISDNCFAINTKVLITEQPIYIYVNDVGSNSVYKPDIQEIECYLEDNFDSITIEMSETPQFELPQDTLVCFDEPLSIGIESQTGFNYIWNTGEHSSIITIDDIGEYILSISEGTGCQASDTINVFLAPECSSIPFIPNVFTPNGDGINNELTVRYGLTPAVYDLKVYDRLGNLVFSSNSISNTWNAKSNGYTYQGVFNYTLRVDEHYLAGTITVL